MEQMHRSLSAELVFKQRWHSTARGHLGTRQCGVPVLCVCRATWLPTPALTARGMRPRLAWGALGGPHSPGKCLLTLVAVSCFSLGFARGTRSFYKTEHQKRTQRKPTCSQHPGLPFRREGLSQRFAFSGLQVHPVSHKPFPAAQKPPHPPPEALRRLPTAAGAPGPPSNLPAFSFHSVTRVLAWTALPHFPSFPWHRFPRQF